MDRRFVTVLGVSLLFALVVATVFYQVTGKMRRAPRPAKQETRDVVIAASALPVGVPIRPADVRIVKMAKEQFPKGAFGKAEEVIGRPVISRILAEEPVLEGRLAERGSGLGLSAVIPVGLRAVPVKVNEVVGVAGFVLPGVRVDVLVTIRPPGDAGARIRTVLQNIVVLSAGQHIEADAKGQPINVTVVTLLVSPEQAETLTLSGTEGKIQLVLRNATDQGVEKTAGTRVAELLGGRDRIPAGRPSRERGQVVVFRGANRTMETIGGRPSQEPEPEAKP